MRPKCLGRFLRSAHGSIRRSVAIAVPFQRVGYGSLSFGGCRSASTSPGRCLCVLIKCISPIAMRLVGQAYGLEEAVGRGDEDQAAVYDGFSGASAAFVVP